MKIIVGLGNPGYRYRRTKHNIGFSVLDAFSARHGFRIRKKNFGGLYGTGRFSGGEIVLFKPMTYMNLSGGAVKGVLSHFGADGEKDLLIVGDDLNIPLGRLRLREKGSSGGHKGLESVIVEIGADFNRLRVGIGSESAGADKSTFVLGLFSCKERRIMAEAVERAASCVETWITEGPTEAMKRFNS